MKEKIISDDVLLKGVLGVLPNQKLGPRTGCRSSRADSGAWRTDAVTDIVALPERTGLLGFFC